MASAFSRLWAQGPAAIVVEVIIGAMVADGLLLGFILLRRAYRKRYFAKRDGRVYELRKKWEALISGEVPYDTWRQSAFDRRIVEEIALDAMEAAGPDEFTRLLSFLRATGLIEKRIFEARKHRGWRRLRALVALGRTRAPEGIPALAEGLRDPDEETRHAALRGLGRIGLPEAGEEILTWLGEAGLRVSPLPLQNALINCCRRCPRMLLPYLQYADRTIREVLARVFGEIATDTLQAEALALASDELPELRAAAARALSHADQHGPALVALTELAQDAVWFVRLRAVVALGEIDGAAAAPPLLRALQDPNRLVRMRAAEGLATRTADMAAIFAEVVAAQDRYALHAYLTAIENAGLRQALEAELQRRESRGAHDGEHLLAVLRSERVVAEPGPPEAAREPVTVSKP